MTTLQKAYPERKSAVRFLRSSRAISAKLNAAGATIALGTDAGVSVGWTAHTELADMVAAGMTPAQVLIAATKTAAEIPRLDRLGDVAAGKSADFIALDANPLDDIQIRGRSPGSTCGVRNPTARRSGTAWALTAAK